MGKYALNHGSGKLHKETCFLVKEAFHSKKAFRIDEVLEHNVVRNVFSHDMDKSGPKA